MDQRLFNNTSALQQDATQLFGSLPDKTLRRCKIAGSVRKPQEGMTFAESVAWTVLSFRNEAASG
jgi:hypothetical protein